MQQYNPIEVSRSRRDVDIVGLHSSASHLAFLLYFAWSLNH